MRVEKEQMVLRAQIQKVRDETTSLIDRQEQLLEPRTQRSFLIVIAPRVPPTLFRMFSVSLELHWISISLALPLSLLRRARVEPPGISEDWAKHSRG